MLHRKREACAQTALRRLVTLNLITIAQKKAPVHSSVQDYILMFIHYKNSRVISPGCTIVPEFA